MSRDDEMIEGIMPEVTLWFLQSMHHVLRSDNFAHAVV
jgi:hypothetical protein